MKYHRTNPDNRFASYVWSGKVFASVEDKKHFTLTLVIFKRIIAVIILTVSLLVIAYTFWQHEIKYALPTPVPVNYQPVNAGDPVILPASLAKKQAYFLHFYNPSCPCSRFNARHIQSLIRNHGDSITFVIIVPDGPSLQNATSEFGDDLMYVTDNDQAIARACGVYSTPQAAIITHDQKLFYRGNYNRSRYCTVKASNFAEISLIALINNSAAPYFGLEATLSYGCELKDPSQDTVIF